MKQMGSGECASCGEWCGEHCTVPMAALIPVAGTHQVVPLCASCRAGYGHSRLVAHRDVFGYEVRAVEQD